MIRINKFIVLVASMVIVFSSCNLSHCPDKNTFIKSFTSFVDEVEEKSRNNSTNWDQVDLDFEDYVDRCYPAFKHKFDDEDKKIFWSKTVKFYFNRYKGDLSQAFSNAEKTFSNEFEEDMKLMLDDIDGDVIPFVKDLFKDDIKKGVDSVLEFLNELGDEIKKDMDEK